MSNPTPFISWYQPYQLDLVQVGEKNGNVKANQVPLIGPKFLLLTKRQFMAKEKKKMKLRQHLTKSKGTVE